MVVDLSMEATIILVKMMDRATEVGCQVTPLRQVRAAAPTRSPSHHHIMVAARRPLLHLMAVLTQHLRRWKESKAVIPSRLPEHILKQQASI
jgi:hypothetical protein